MLPVDARRQVVLPDVAHLTGRRPPRDTNRIKHAWHSVSLLSARSNKIAEYTYIPDPRPPEQIRETYTCRYIKIGRGKSDNNRILTCGGQLVFWLSPSSDVGIVRSRERGEVVPQGVHDNPHHALEARRQPAPVLQRRVQRCLLLVLLLLCGARGGATLLLLLLLAKCDARQVLEFIFAQQGLYLDRKSTQEKDKAPRGGAGAAVRAECAEFYNIGQRAV